MQAGAWHALWDGKRALRTWQLQTEALSAFRQIRILGEQPASTEGSEGVEAEIVDTCEVRIRWKAGDESGKECERRPEADAERLHFALCNHCVHREPLAGVLALCTFAGAAVQRSPGKCGGADCASTGVLRVLGLFVAVAACDAKSTEDCWRMAPVLRLVVGSSRSCPSTVCAARNREPLCHLSSTLLTRCAPVGCPLASLSTQGQWACWISQQTAWRPQPCRPRQSFLRYRARANVRKREQATRDRIGWRDAPCERQNETIVRRRSSLYAWCPTRARLGK